MLGSNLKVSIKVNLSLQDNQAQDLIKLVSEISKTSCQRCREKTNKKIKLAPLPHKKDDEGNVIFKFKMKASGTKCKNW